MELRHDGVYQVGEVLIAKLEGPGVRAGFKDDFLILREQFVDIDRHSIEIPEGRHRPDFTVRKQPFELIFGSQSHTTTLQRFLKSGEVDRPGRG